MSFDEKAAENFLNGKDAAFDPQKAESFLDDPVAFKKEEAEKPKPKSSIDEIITGANQYAAGVNDVILNTLGLPGDITNWVAEKMGAEYRAYGSETIRKFGRDLRIGTPKGEEPDTAAYKAGKYTGIGLEFLAPFLRAGKGAVNAIKIGGTVEPSAGVTKGVMQQMAAPFITQGKTAYASEIASSTAAGIGAYYGGKEYGEVGEVLGGILFGIPAGIAPYMAPRMKAAATRTLFPYTKKGGAAKAGGRLRELSETEHVLSNLERAKDEVLPSSRIPPAKLSGDKHLIALQNRILKDDPELYHKFNLEADATNDLARKELEKLGGDTPIEETQAWMGYRVKRIKDLIDARIDKSIRKARDSLTGISPKEQRRTVNTVVRHQVDSALSEARTIESEVWDKVNKSVKAGTNIIRGVYNDHVSARTKASDPAEIPEFVHTFLGKKIKGKVLPGTFDETESVKTLHAFRTRLINTVREEKAKDVPNWNKVRILDDLQEAVLKEIEETPSGKDFQQAIATSRELNEKFRGGIMDIILGHERTGGRVAPEISIESIKGGPKAAVQMREVLNASPESYGMLEELLKLNMVQSNVISSKGKININAARKYLEKNEDMLEMFPDTARALNKAIGLEERATRIIATGKARTAAITKSRAAKMAESKPGRILSDILTSQNPEQEMKKIISQSNPAGRKGLKNDVIDYMLKKARLGTLDEHGMPAISGKKMLNIWNTEGKVLKQTMNEDELSRVETIINTFVKNSEDRLLPEVKDIVYPENPIVSAVVTTIAARAGARLGAGTSGASLKTASMMSANAQKIVNSLDTSRATQLLKDAIQDPELFKALYSDASKSKEIVIADRILQGWMVAHTISTMEDK